MQRLVPLLMLALLPLAGCIDDDGASEGGDGADHAGPTTEVMEATLANSAATPERTFSSGGQFPAAIAPTETTTGYVLELTWDATAPSNEELDLWVRLAGSGTVDATDPTGTADSFQSTPDPIAAATGTSPLRIVLPIEDIEDPMQAYDVLARAATPVGVAANQPVTLHLTTFDGIPFDGEFTALAA